MFWNRSAKLRTVGLAAIAGSAVLTMAVSAALAPPEEARVPGDTTTVSLPTQQPTAFQASSDVAYLLQWLTATGNNDGASFLIVDKKNATAHAFDGQQHWLASTPVLVGSAIGDDTVAGIGTRPLALVQAHERTTPAGRFVAEPGVNAQGEAVVWVDYEAAVSMHSVRLANASEQRLERLASLDVGRRRISYGCVNFPGAFFTNYVLPVAVSRRLLVYVLPETRSVDSVFGPARVLAGDRT